VDFHDTERRRVEDGYIVECLVCGKEFEATRIDAAFCSSTCRSRFHRAAKMLDKRIERAERAIDDLIKHLPIHGESRTFKTLEKLQKRIESALASVEAEERN